MHYTIRNMRRSMYDEYFLFLVFLFREYDHSFKSRLLVKQQIPVISLQPGITDK